jgi:hypothetical protein
VIEAKAAELNLDRPIPIRYVRWASGAVRGDFGTTITGQAISNELGPPSRGQPAAAAHRFGIGHADRRRHRRMGSDRGSTT